MMKLISIIIGLFLTLNLISQAKQISNFDQSVQTHLWERNGKFFARVLEDTTNYKKFTIYEYFENEMKVIYAPNNEGNFIFDFTFHNGSYFCLQSTFCEDEADNIHKFELVEISEDLSEKNTIYTYCSDSNDFLNHEIFFQFYHAGNRLFFNKGRNSNLTKLFLIDPVLKVANPFTVQNDTITEMGIWQFGEGILLSSPEIGKYFIQSDNNYHDFNLPDFHYLFDPSQYYKNGKFFIPNQDFNNKTTLHDCDIKTQTNKLIFGSEQYFGLGTMLTNNYLYFKFDSLYSYNIFSKLTSNLNNQTHIDFNKHLYFENSDLLLYREPNNINSELNDIYIVNEPSLYKEFINTIPTINTILTLNNEVLFTDNSGIFYSLNLSNSELKIIDTECQDVVLSYQSDFSIIFKNSIYFTKRLENNNKKLFTYNGFETKEVVGETEFSNPCCYFEIDNNLIFTALDSNNVNQVFMITEQTNTSTQISKHKSITIFPNPTTNKINLNVPENLGGYIYLIDINAKVLRKEKIHAGLELYTLDISDLTTGSYLVEFMSLNDREQRLYIGKFIKL